MEAQKAIDFSKLLDGDVFFSHSRDIVGGCIRIGEAADRPLDFLKPKTWGAATDRSLTNHTGFLVSVRRQWFVAEVTPQGIRKRQ